MDQDGGGDYCLREYSAVEVNSWPEEDEKEFLHSEALTCP